MERVSESPEKQSEPIVEIRDLHYARGQRQIFSGLNIKIKRGKVTAVMGPSGTGKTTLMRAIANEQVEGFPKKDQLKTIFVEHEIPEMEVGEDEKGFPILNIDLCGVDWVVH